LRFGLLSGSQALSFLAPLAGADTQEFLSIDDIAPPIVHELQWRLGNPIDMEPRDHDWQEMDLIVMDEPSCSVRRLSRVAETELDGMSGTSGAAWHIHTT
jgi:hypothetical protein